MLELQAVDFEASQGFSECILVGVVVEGRSIEWSVGCCFFAGGFGSGYQFCVHSGVGGGLIERESVARGDGSGCFRTRNVGMFGSVGRLAAVGVLGADLNAAARFNEEVDEKVDRSAHITVGTGNVWATTGHGDDGEDGAKRDFIFPRHEGFHLVGETGAKLSVVVERPGECEKVV